MEHNVDGEDTTEDADDNNGDEMEKEDTGGRTEQEAGSRPCSISWFLLVGFCVVSQLYSEVIN